MSEVPRLIKDGIEELSNYEKEINNIFDSIFTKKYHGEDITDAEEKTLQLCPKLLQTIGCLRDHLK